LGHCRCSVGARLFLLGSLLHGRRSDPRLSLTDACHLRKVMMDPKAMPFDGKRMIWGGFKVVVSK
jgi:uncharacterized protein YbaA (DUF1428 family)